MDRGRDGVMEDLAILGGTVAIAAVVWWFAGHRIVHAAVAASAVLSLPAAVLGDIAGPVELPFVTGWLLRPSQAARDILFSVGLAEIAGHREILVAGGRNAGLFAIPFLFLAARASLGLRPDRAFRIRHSLDSNIAQQARTWPAALRPLRINPAGDDQPETAVDPAAALAIRNAHSHFHLMGGGLGAPDPLIPPREPSQPLARRDLEGCNPQLINVLDMAGWDWRASGFPEDAALFLLRKGHPGHREAAVELLRSGGWRTGVRGPAGWHTVFDGLAGAGRWREAHLAGWMAAHSPEPPGTGSFLLPPVPPQPEPPPLGRAMRPEEWLDARCLRDGTGHCDPAEVETQLALQLTRRFGIDALKPHERAFAACMGEFRSGSRDLIDRLAVAFASCRRPGDCGAVLDGEPELRGRIDGLLERHRDGLARLAASHHWVETGLLEIWRAGRRGQPILPPAAVPWLKPEGRTLWYAVQCCGGLPVIEAAGVHAHHLAELQYGAPLPVPHVRLAVTALIDVYLDRSKERMRARGPGPGGFDDEFEEG